VDIEARDEMNGSTAFHFACERGQLDCAQALAAAGCDVAAAGSKSNTALMLAAGEGHAVVVAWLLGEGGAAGTLEARNEEGDTAFIFACNNGQLACAQALAAAGCDVHVACNLGNTALICAAGYGNVAVVAWLLREDGAVETLEARDKGGDTAFLQTCGGGWLECAQALAAAGCDVVATNSKGETALIHAVNHGCVAVVAWLLGEGVAVGTLEWRDKHGLTAFLQACGGGQLECVELLVRAGCDIDVKAGLPGTRRRQTGKEFAQSMGEAAVVARLGELHAERAAATRRHEANELMAAGEYCAAATLLAKLLRQAPDDVELGQLLAESERQQAEADAAADVLARAAEAELLAMEAGEQAAESSKVGKKKQKRKRQQERARAAKATVEAAARAREREPVPELEAVSVAALQPQPQGEMDVVEALLAGLGLAEEHVLACREHEMDLGAPR
jgi:ankyrin repeat protein